MPTPAEQPRFDQPVVDQGGRVTQAWANYFLRMASAQSNDDLRALYDALAARVAQLEDGQELDFSIFGANSINVDGAVQPGGMVLITLVGDADAPGNTMYYGTGPAGGKGWFPVSSAVQVVSGELTKTVGTDGVSTFGLADVPDTATGALLATTFDAKGRKTGSKPATITGTTNQINVANGNAAAGLPTLSLAAPVLASLAKADSAVQSVVPGTGISVNNADPRNPIISSTVVGGVSSVNARTGAVAVPDFVSKPTTPTAADYGRPIIDGDRWFNSSTGISYTYNGGAWLSDGSSAPVSSVFGRTGAVVAQSGDYTAAQVGADPAGSAAAVAAAKYDKVGGTIGGAASGSDPVRVEGSGAGYVGIDVVNLNASTTTIARLRFVTSNKNVGFLAGAAGTVGEDGFSIYDYSLNTPMMFASAASVRPGTDNARTLGSATARWSVVYAGTGSINTSDAREKSPVRTLEQAEISAAAQLGREIGAYKWLASVEAKGDAARWHIGMTVQRAIEVMQSHGLDPFAYGFICYDSWEEEPDQSSEWPDELDDDGNVFCPGGSVASPGRAAGDLYSFRPDGLHAFILRGLAARLEALEARLTS